MAEKKSVKAELRYGGRIFPLPVYEDDKTYRAAEESRVTLAIGDATVSVSAVGLFGLLIEAGAVPDVWQTQSQLVDLSSAWAGACADLMSDTKRKGAN